jgi:multidrug resistance efflux pump
LRQAQLRLEQIQDPPDEADVEIARTAASDAAAAYQEARSNLTITEHGVSVGDAVRAARAARDDTYRHYQNLVAKNTDEDRITAAHDAYLDALGAYNRAVESAELQMTVAQNDATRAYHALEQAQNSLDELLEGADGADIEAAQLDVEAAQLALDEAQSSLDEATLVAPFDGIVAAVEVEPGDTVAPGQAVLVLATLDDLQVHTTDLTELDVARVAEGQPAKVTVDALPEQEFAGIVSEVGLQPEDYRGDVVYAVTIELTDARNAPLRWGMTTLVEIETD